MKSLGYLDFLKNLALKKCNRIDRHSFLIDQNKNNQIQPSIKIDTYNFQQILNMIHTILSQFIMKNFEIQQQLCVTEKFDDEPQPCVLKINKQKNKQKNFKVDKMQNLFTTMKKCSNLKQKVDGLICIQKYDEIIQDEQIKLVRLQKEKSDNLRKIELQFLKKKKKFEKKVQDQKQNKNNSKYPGFNKISYTFDFNGQLIKQKKKPQLKKIQKKKQLFQYKLSKSQSLAKIIPLQEVVYQKIPNFQQKEINLINWNNQSPFQKISPINSFKIQKGISISIYGTNNNKFPKVSQNNLNQNQNNNLKLIQLSSIKDKNMDGMIGNEKDNQKIKNMNKSKNVVFKSIATQE